MTNSLDHPPKMQPQEDLYAMPADVSAFHGDFYASQSAFAPEVSGHVQTAELPQNPQRQTEQPMPQQVENLAPDAGFEAAEAGITGVQVGRFSVKALTKSIVQRFGRARRKDAPVDSQATEHQTSVHPEEQPQVSVRYESRIATPTESSQNSLLPEGWLLPKAESETNRAFVGTISSRSSHERPGFLDRREILGFKKMPTFDEQLRDVSHRQEPLSAFVRTIDAQSTITSKGHEPVATTEIAAMQQLDNFLQVAERALPSEYVEGVPTAEDVKRFRENLSFLGTPELEESTEGLAAYWQSYLAENPSRKIVIYEPYENVEKSSTFVTSKILGYLEKNAPADTRDRILSFSAIKDNLPQHLDADTKIVIADDWVTSGSSMAGYIEPDQSRYANRSDKNDSIGIVLERAGMSQYMDNVEVNLLVARQDQLDKGLYDMLDDRLKITHVPPVVAYYVSPAKKDYYTDPSPSGAHGSVDYGWETVLEKYARGVAESTHQDTEIPLLAKVSSTYKTNKSF